MKVLFKVLGRLFLFLFLTILTQIGGIVYLISIFIARRWKIRFRAKSILVFLVVYFISTLLIVPVISPFFGREKVKHTESIFPANYVTVLLNRNYVKPEFNHLLTRIESNLENTGIKISYLDANFPFIDGFPLLPHLSHNDGEKLDVSLIYETSSGTITNLQKSISGYGVFEGPMNTEFNQIDKCLINGYFQYDYPKYLTFGKVNSHLIFSERGTKALIKAILRSDFSSKLFIEPHLRQRLELSDNRVRYHGGKAVRHDDHIHIQL